MLSALKLELYRAFHNKRMVFVLLLGSIILCSQIITGIVLKITWSPQMFVKRYAYPDSVFNRWVGLDSSSFQAPLFYMILPILAAFPCGDSFFQDLNTGYIKNLYTRTEKKYYCLSKFAATFLSGGVAISIPLLLSLLITMLIVPSFPPDPSAVIFNIFEEQMWSNIFLYHPYIYVLLYILLDFIFGGLFAILPFFFSMMINNRYVLILSPFVLYILLFILFEGTTYVPYYFLYPIQSISANPSIILTEGLTFLVLSVLSLWYQGVKNETV